MKKHSIKTHPMWNPKEPTYADVGDVVGKAFAAGLRPDPVEEPAAADLSPELLEVLVRDILRGQWGFDGLVMSDWFAEHDTDKSTTAGMDLEMPGTTRHRGEALVQAVREGRVSTDDVRACAGRVLRLVEREKVVSIPVVGDDGMATSRRGIRPAR